MNMKQCIKTGIYCFLLQSIHLTIHTAPPVKTATKAAPIPVPVPVAVKATAAKTAPVAKSTAKTAAAPTTKAAAKTVAKTATAPVAKAAAKAAVKTAVAPTVKVAVKKPAVKKVVKPSPILTSVYIQNTFNKDATLNQIEVIVANQKKPIIKNDLAIKVPGKKSIYDKGSMLSFDIAASSKNIAMFNGIKSITIDKDQIVFDTLKTAFQSDPIRITYKNNKWVIDIS